MLELLNVSPATWSSLSLSLRLFLRPISKSGEGLLDFFHRQLAKAIARRYGSPEADAEVHSRLASYFLGKLGVDNINDGDWRWKREYPRAVGELPYHLTRARRWYDYLTLSSETPHMNADDNFLVIYPSYRDDVSRVLGDVEFINMKCIAGFCHDLVEGTQHTVRIRKHTKRLTRTPSDYTRLLEDRGGGWHEDVEDCKTFVMGNLHVLSARPQLCLQQAVNSGSPALGRKALEILKSTGTGYIEWLNRLVASVLK